MRCRRCHSKIDPSKKMCPVCGTLVRKPRGSLKLAREVGGTPIDNLISDSHRVFGSSAPKILLAVLLGGAMIAVAALTFNCGEHRSCGSCESLEACSMVRASCDSCTSSCDSCASACSSNIESCAESCKRPEAVVSDGDTVSASETQPTEPERRPVEDVGVKPRGGSCGGRNSDDGAAYEDNRNSVPYGRECLFNDTLYYVNSSGIYFLTDNDETGLVFAGKGISALHCENSLLYFLQDGGIQSVSIDGGDRKTVVNAADSELGSIIGYGICDGSVCYWGRNEKDDMLIFSRPLDGGEAIRLYRGECVQQQVYRGDVYFLSRDDKDFNTLYRVSLTGGRAQRMLSVPVTYFALCRGEVFAYTWIDSTASLYSVDCRSLEVTHSWEFIAIRGITANDEYVYYYCNDADGIGSIFRMSPDGTGNRKLFADNSVIQLGHVSGNRISVYSGINENAENRYEGSKYMIIDLDSGDKLRV